MRRKTRSSRTGSAIGPNSAYKSLGLIPKLGKPRQSEEVLSEPQGRSARQGARQTARGGLPSQRKYSRSFECLLSSQKCASLAN
eukprot:6201507-Pleurochrysis_carterae.AAC.3